MTEKEMTIGKFNEQIIEKMKKRMKTHPYLKKILKKLMDDGLTEEEALNFMIAAWRNQSYLREDEK